MRYSDFLDEVFRGIRDEAPPVTDCQRLHRWLFSIGELLHVMQPAERAAWQQRYADFLVIHYGHVQPPLALLTLRQAQMEAEDAWPARGVR